MKDSTTALLSWDPVPAESVRGHFKGYKVSLYLHMYSVTYIFMLCSLFLYEDDGSGESTHIWSVQTLLVG